jgi:predicted nucleic acid-binding protein
LADLIVDTDILIDVGRAVPEAVQFLDRMVRESTVAISSMSEMELIVGCRDRQESRKVARLLKRLNVLKISEAITDLAVRLVTRYSLSHGLAIPDAIIAGTALHERAPLATKNRRDYQFIAGLRLASYP